MTADNTAPAEAAARDPGSLTRLINITDKVGGLPGPNSSAISTTVRLKARIMYKVSLILG